LYQSLGNEILPFLVLSKSRLCGKIVS
jgi:hypothetical protein